MRAIAAIAIASVTLAACGFGGSRLNPINWIGGDRSVTVAAAPSSSEPIAQQILSLNAAPTPGGIIVSAIALPPTQGYWDARLVRLPSSDPSVYLMEFQLAEPVVRQPAGTQVSREVLGGTFLTQGDLSGISSIAVQGLSNQRVIRRQ